MPPTRPWYETAFDADYLHRYPLREHSEASRAVASLLARAPIPAGATLLDLCCGAGRHSLALSRAGFRVVGLDLSRPLLEAGRRLTDRIHSGWLPVRGTMERLPFGAESFRAVVNFFTAFGYFEDEERNNCVLREVHRVLAPGGMFLLDFLNRPRAQAEVERDGHVPRTQAVPGGQVVATRRVSPDGRRLEKLIEFQDPGGTLVRSLLESVRAYHPSELRAMLTGAGLDVVEEWGDYDASPHTGASPRFIAICRKA